MKQICQDPVLKQRLSTLVSEPVGLGATEFAAFVAAERVRWGNLINELKIKVD